MTLTGCSRKMMLNISPQSLPLSTDPTVSMEDFTTSFFRVLFRQDLRLKEPKLPNVMYIILALRQRAWKQRSPTRQGMPCRYASFMTWTIYVRAPGASLLLPLALCTCTDSLFTFLKKFSSFTLYVFSLTQSSV